MLSTSSQVSSNRPAVPRSSNASDIKSRPPSSATGEALRSRNKRRDEALRRKVEQELSKRKIPQRKSSSLNLRNYKRGTVASLKPSPAIIVPETYQIAKVAQIMASKRNDAILVINAANRLCGILTDKDIVYRVVAEELDIRCTSVMSVMTPNPTSVYDKDLASDALAIMTQRKFRHLPVISEIDLDHADNDNLASVITDNDFNGTATNVVGVLDITKCVFEKLEDLEKKVTEDQNIILAMETLERRGSFVTDQIDSFKASNGCPDISTIISSHEEAGLVLPEVYTKTTVREAAKIMKKHHATAVLVINQSSDNSELDKLAGIFTTKDVVLRVLASGLDPNTTSVTPHPDSVSPDTSILDALKKLHVGRYMHLPVLENQTPVGLVDVQQLTMAMLTYLINKDQKLKETSSGEGKDSGPMWNKFWSSTLTDTMLSTTEPANNGSILDDEVGSDFSGPQCSSQSPSSLRDVGTTRGVVGLPDRSSLAAGSVADMDESTYPFKLCFSGRFYWMTCAFGDYDALRKMVAEKVACSMNGVRILYEDDEGDYVTVECDRDLCEAVALARRMNCAKVVLFLDDGSDQIPQKSQVKLLSHGHSAASVVIDALRDAPLPINVAMCAGIVLVAGFLLKKILS